MKALSFGSLNLDYTYHVDHFVRPGETTTASSRSLACGGKGLNQSIALSHAGVEVYHAGAVGDSDGTLLLNTLKKHNVNTDYVKEINGGSGTAFIQVDKNGENCIVIEGGANQMITPSIVDEVLANFSKGDWLILQNEISSLSYLITKAHEKGMIVVLNPSPFNASILSLPLDKIDYFLLNEKEAEGLADTEVNTIAVLKDKYPNAKIVITLGSKGSIFWDGSTLYSQEAMKVTAIDTVAAGDTYTGFFIGSLMNGKTPPEALQIATTAAGISVTRNGASTSIPMLEEVLDKMI